MQCVDTAFAHAAFDGHVGASSLHGHWLAPDGASKWSNDAAIATAQTALRSETCDRRSIPPPEGIFHQTAANHVRSLIVLNFL
jgi:hypothetical protein